MANNCCTCAEIPHCPFGQNLLSQRLVCATAICCLTTASCSGRPRSNYCVRFQDWRHCCAKTREHTNTTRPEPPENKARGSVLAYGDVQDRGRLHSPARGDYFSGGLSNQPEFVHTGVRQI